MRGGGGGLNIRRTISNLQGRRKGGWGRGGGGERERENRSFFLLFLKTDF